MNGKLIPHASPARPVTCAVPAGAVLIGGILTLALPEMAVAQDAGGVLDSALGTMQARLEAMGATMASRAQALMLGLLVLDLVIRFGRFAIRGDPLEVMMQDWAYCLGFVTVAWGMAEVIPEVVQWLARTALDFSSAAGAVDVKPSDIVTDGIARAVGWLGEIRFASPGTWFYIFASLISLVALAIAVAMVVITYTELYLVALAGIITLGFAGLAQTQSIATGFFMALVGKAMKLFGIMVVIAATGEITAAIAAYGSSGVVAGFEAAMTMILLQIISGMMVLTLPATLERLVSGSKLSTGAAESAGKSAGEISVKAGAAAATKVGTVAKGRIGK